MYRSNNAALIMDMMIIVLIVLALSWASLLAMKAYSLYQEAQCPVATPRDTRTVADLHAPFKGTLP